MTRGGKEQYFQSLKSLRVPGRHGCFRAGLGRLAGWSHLGSLALMDISSSLGEVPVSAPG